MSASVQPWMLMSSAIKCNFTFFQYLIHPFLEKSWEQARLKGKCKKQFGPYGVLKVVNKLGLESRTTTQYLCLASYIVKYLEWTKSWAISSTTGVWWWYLQMTLFRSWGSKQRCNSPGSFQAYAIDETQSITSSSGVMTPSFTILSNSALTLGCMEIGHFHVACMTGWALSCSLMVYSSGNQPMPWNLSGNSLMRYSVDFIGVVFLGVSGAAGAGVGCGSWEVSWMTLTAQFILMTSYLSHNGGPRKAGLGMPATYQWEFIWWGCTLGEPVCQVMDPWSDPKRGIWVPL